MMKNFQGILIVLPLLAVLLPVSGWAEGLYQQRFNEPGIELKGGAVLGGDGTGVSGKAGDQAYSAEPAGGKAVAVFPTLALTKQGDVEELTVTAWYRATGELADGVTLFSALGTVLIWDAKKQQWVWRVETAKSDGSSGPYWFYLSNPPLGAWSKPGEWTFIALVWSRREGRARVYQGNASSKPMLGREIPRPEKVEPLQVAAKDRHTIGNDRFKPERAFVGKIDNVRFYDKAFDFDALTAIYTADLANEPEPAVLGKAPADQPSSAK